MIQARAPAFMSCGCDALTPILASVPLPAAAYHLAVLPLMLWVRPSFPFRMHNRLMDLV